MKESYGEDLASHTDPESWTLAREGGREALTGVCAGELDVCFVNPVPVRLVISQTWAMSGTAGSRLFPYGGKKHVPSDLVVDRGVSSASGRLILDFPCPLYSRPRNLSENNLSNINRINIYH